MLNFVHDNLFNAKDGVLVHLGSADFKMKNSLGREMNKRFDLVNKLSAQYPDFQNRFKRAEINGICLLTDGDGVRIATLVVKEKASDKIIIDGIYAALNDLYVQCVRLGIDKITMPMLGCGAGGIDPEEFLSAVDIFDFLPIDVTVCVPDDVFIAGVDDADDECEDKGDNQYYSLVKVFVNGSEVVLKITPEHGRTADSVEEYIEGFLEALCGGCEQPFDYEWEPLEVSDLDDEEDCDGRCDSCDKCEECGCCDEEDEDEEDNVPETPPCSGFRAIQFSKIRVFSDDKAIGFVMDVPEQFLCKGLPYNQYIEKWRQLTAFMSERFPDLNWTPIDDEA